MPFDIVAPHAQSSLGHGGVMKSYDQLIPFRCRKDGVVESLPVRKGRNRQHHLHHPRMAPYSVNLLCGCLWVLRSDMDAAQESLVLFEPVVDHPVIVC